MTRLNIIHAIEEAESYHEEQLQKVAKLLEGKRVDKPTPLDKEACNFGKWLYGDAKKIQNLIGAQFYDNIELMHGFWHAQYRKIYEIFYDVHRNAIMTFLFGNRKSVDPQMLQKAQEYFQELQNITQNLLKALYISKKRILALSENMFV